MKLLNIRVIPNATKDEVLQEENRFKVYVRAPAVEGKANKALTCVLADFFKVKKSAIEIIRGERSRDKVIKIV